MTTVCPGFVQTPMTPMDSATPFIMSAEAAARRIARLIARRRGGVVSLPLADGASDVDDRPAARRGRRPAGPRSRPTAAAGTAGGARPMIDLALKMLLDEKARFAATVLGRGLRRRAGAGPGRPVLRPAGERQHHDRSARRRPLGHGAEHAERRLRQSVSRELRAASSLDPGRGAGGQPDRLVRDRRPADRGEGVGGLLRAGRLSGLAVSRGTSSRATRPTCVAAGT